MWNVKEAIAHQALAARPRHGKLTLPGERHAWAQEQAKVLVAGLGESGYDIVGSLDELAPRPASPASPVGTPAGPGDQPVGQVLDAAVEAASALVLNQYRSQYPAARPQRGHGQRGLAERVESTVAASPRLKRMVRELSSRYPAVRKLRILAWMAMERTRAMRREGRDASQDRPGG
jgi:hypothetical protein